MCFLFNVLQAHVLVCRALSNMLLLPWPSLPEAEQQWPSRSASHARLISTLTHQFRLLPRPPDHHPTSECTCRKSTNNAFMCMECWMDRFEIRLLAVEFHWFHFFLCNLYMGLCVAADGVAFRELPRVQKVVGIPGLKYRERIGHCVLFCGVFTRNYKGPLIYNFVIDKKFRTFIK